MEVVFTERALKDLSYWKKTGNQAIQKKISNLIRSIEDSPYEGIGKNPKP